MKRKKHTKIMCLKHRIYNYIFRFSKVMLCEDHIKKVSKSFKLALFDAKNLKIWKISVTRRECSLLLKLLLLKHFQQKMLQV